MRPVNLKNEDNVRLIISWDDGSETASDWFRMRANCPCAGCVDEMTGKRTLNPEDLPADVRPNSVSFVGQYAVRFNWSDGHDTGIYTFDKLREISS